MNDDPNADHGNAVEAAGLPRRRGRPPGNSGSRAPGSAIAQSMITGAPGYRTVEGPFNDEVKAKIQNCRHVTGCKLLGGPEVCHHCVTPADVVGAKACSCPQTALVDGVPVFDCHCANTAEPPPAGFYCQRHGPEVTAAESAKHIDRDAAITQGRKGANPKFGGFTEAERTLVDSTLADVKAWWLAMPASRSDADLRARVVNIVERIVERVFG